MQIITSQANKILVHVKKYNQYDFSGLFYTPLQESAIPFSSFAELVLKLEHQFDELQFPQNAQKIKSFIHGKNKQGEIKKTETEFCSHDIEQNGNSCKEKFYIHVLFRQNASWQGHIEWINRERSNDFRSTLELLHMIHEVLLKQEKASASID